jgi:glycosyltransferase involved in cell wall biosynthesis
MHNKKVFLLQEIIPNYRVPVFTRLSALSGVDLTVYHSDASSTKMKENLKSADVIDGFRNKKISSFDTQVNTFQFSFIWEILRWHPDVVITGQMGRIDTLLSLLICKLLGIRFLWFQGGVPHKDPIKIREYAIRGRLNKWLGPYNPRRFISYLADGIIAYSDHAKQYYIDYGFSPDHIWIAYNSPDTDSLANSRAVWSAKPKLLAVERARFSPNDESVLLMIGRLNKQRRVDILLSAMKMLMDRGIETSLVIVGDGGEREAYEKQAKDLGLQNVYFEGAVYDDHILCRYLLVSDIFVMPGAASIALKIAMAMARPVVTADYGLEVHDIEVGVNGYVFPLGDERALTDILEELLRSDEKMGLIGNGGFCTIRDKVNIQSMVEGFRCAIFGEETLDLKL